MERFTTSVGSCPVCSSPLHFRSAYTQYTVCKICNSSIERKRDGTISISAIKVVKGDDSELVYVGKHGEWKGRPFEVIGGIHCFSNRSSHRRWTIIFMDGPPGLLVDTEGLLAVYEDAQDKVDSKMQGLDKLKLASESIVINGSKSYLFNRDTCTDLFVEGEVYLQAGIAPFQVYELGNELGERMEVIEAGNMTYCSNIFYTDAETLKFNISSYQPVPKTVECGSCKKEYVLLLPRYNHYFFCGNCNAWNKINAHGNTAVQAGKHSKPQMIMPIGSRGNFDGMEYLLTCVTQKTETGSKSIFWNEYTLFNPVKGFMFLSEFNGHWIMLREIKMNKPWPAYEKEMVIDGEPYHLYNEYGFRIVEAEGESFVSGDVSGIEAKEYISPPEIYIAEKNRENEVTWFRGMHIRKEDVEAAFGNLHYPMPEQVGVGAVQPMKFYVNMGLLKKMSLIFLGIFLAVQLLFSSIAKERVVLEKVYNDLVDTVASKGIITESFQLESWRSNLQFSISSFVANSWFEASFTLVNDKTGKEYNFEKGVEYYFGVEDGESWSEGSASGEITLSSIPRGTYHLNIFPSFDKSSTNNSFSIMLVNDVPMWRNFFIILGLLAIYPVVQWFRDRSFEKKRWYGSENNPYANDDEDE